MRTTPWIAGLTALTVAVSARPAKRGTQITGKPYQITNLVITDVNTSNTSLSFTLHDPEPNSGATATCSSSWAHGSADYPRDSYAECGNSTLGWNIASWTSAQSFVLGLESFFTDPSLGSPPYDQATTFAHASISSANVEYTNATSQFSGVQKGNVTIQAPIYATIAKKR